MDIKDMQKETDSWIKENTPGYWSPLSMVARLSEEVGELARIINHKYGDKKKKDKEIHDSIEGELGDLLFAIICTANSFNIDLDKAFQKTMIKCEKRDKKRFK